MIDVPQHGSWPGGHASEGFMAATVLFELIKERAGLNQASEDLLEGQLNALAARIATNRVVAGLHYPIDTEVGMVVGQRLGAYLVALCQGAKSVDAFRFENKAPDIGYIDFMGKPSGLDFTGPIALDRSADSLKYFWQEAIKEWA